MSRRCGDFPALELCRLQAVERGFNCWRIPHAAFARVESSMFGCLSAPRCVQVRVLEAAHRQAEEMWEGKCKILGQELESAGDWAARHAQALEAFQDTHNVAEQKWAAQHDRDMKRLKEAERRERAQTQALAIAQVCMGGRGQLLRHPPSLLSHTINLTISIAACTWRECVSIYTAVPSLCPAPFGGRAFWRLLAGCRKLSSADKAFAKLPTADASHLCTGGARGGGGKASGSSLAIDRGPSTGRYQVARGAAELASGAAGCE